MSGPLHIAVLMGGWSAEREVSLMSGNGCADALESLGHRVTRIDMGRDVAARLAEARPDLVFNALHGTPGEDGSVQGLLDLMGLRYTHSGLATSVIAIDKVLTKLLLVPAGVPMPGGRIVRSVDLFEGDPMARPYVLKPVNEGSSVGVAIVTDSGNYGNPIARDAVERAKGRTVANSLAVAGDSSDAALAEGVLQLLASVVGRRTDTQWRALDLLARPGATGVRVARDLGVSPQNVSKLRRDALWQEEREARLAAARLLALADAAPDVVSDPAGRIEA